MKLLTLALLFTIPLTAQLERSSIVVIPTTNSSGAPLATGTLKYRDLSVPPFTEGFRATATLTSNLLWVLPASDANGCLASDGHGNLSWNTSCLTSPDLCPNGTTFFCLAKSYTAGWNAGWMGDTQGLYSFTGYNSSGNVVLIGDAGNAAGLGGAGEWFAQDNTQTKFAAVDGVNGVTTNIGVRVNVASPSGTNYANAIFSASPGISELGRVFGPVNTAPNLFLSDNLSYNETSATWNADVTSQGAPLFQITSSNTSTGNAFDWYTQLPTSNPVTLSKRLEILNNGQINFGGNFIPLSNNTYNLCSSTEVCAADWVTSALSQTYTAGWNAGWPGVTTGLDSFAGYNSSGIVVIVGDAGHAAGLSGAGEWVAYDAAGNFSASVDGVSGVAVATGKGYFAEGKTGVTCPTGAPTALFATDKGIVIHC